MIKVYLIACSLLIFSCNQKTKNRFLLQISKDIWSNREHDVRKDSVLYVSQYKRTSKYVTYAIGLSSRPIMISKNLEGCYETIDDQSIFINNCEAKSEDYKYLLRKKLIKYSQTSFNALDGDHHGYMYIFKEDNPQAFRKVETAKYFIVLGNVSDIFREPSFDGEQKIFDSTATYFWTKRSY